MKTENKISWGLAQSTNIMSVIGGGMANVSCVLSEQKDCYQYRISVPKV